VTPLRGITTRLTNNLYIEKNEVRLRLFIGKKCIFAFWDKEKLILVMSKYEIPFLTAAVQAFGQRFAMPRQAAFNYLHKHKGLSFLIEFYDVEHLQSMDETIDDLLIICQQNGGLLA
jgi:hypothetical protein